MNEFGYNHATVREALHVYRVSVLRFVFARFFRSSSALKPLNVKMFFAITVSYFQILFLVLPSTTLTSASPTFNPTDYSPDDPFPPYPPLTYDNGTNITIQALRGTRLYGWKGKQTAEQVSRFLVENFKPRTH